MFRKAALRPGTVISYGILACCICYFVITTPARVSIGAAAVKILVPDNSLAAGQGVRSYRDTGMGPGTPSAFAAIVRGLQRSGISCGIVGSGATETMMSDRPNPYGSLAGY